MSKVDYLEWRDLMIIGLADRMPHDGEVTIGGRKLAQELGLLVSESWLETLRQELEKNNWAYVDWDGDEVGFQLYGQGLAEAARIRRSKAKPTIGQKIDSWNWQMWSVVVAVAALAAYIFVEIAKP